MEIRDRQTTDVDALTAVAEVVRRLDGYPSRLPDLLRRRWEHGSQWIGV